MKRVLVSDIMTREPITVSPDESLANCSKKMIRKMIGSLLITDKKKLVGFLSQRDVLWTIVKKPNADLTKIRAGDISPKKIITIKQDATLKEAIDKMNKSKFDRLPVVKNGGELVGIITAKDILTFNPEIYPELEEFASIREESEKLRRVSEAKENDFTEGVCEHCGGWDSLSKLNGMMVCQACRNSL